MPVGEVILGAVLQVIFEKLASAGISQFLKLAKRKNKKIEAETIQKWEQTLRMIATLLTDAEHRRQTDKGTFLKKWFEDLEDLAYDLEDILDEFATEAQLFMLQKEAKEEDHDVHDAVITGFFDSAKHKVKSLLACGSTAGQQFQYSKEDLPSRIREINIRLERRLKNLQTLEEFVLAAERGSRIRELSNLLQLSGGLSIFGLENVTSVEDAQKAQLHEKKGLDKLHLEWESWSDEVDDNTKIQVLEHLNPHTSIKECFLRGYRGLTFPTWLGDSSFSLMVDIELTDCKECESLPPLGRLPSLKNLKVEGMDGIKQVGLEFYGSLGCSISFPALETLSFDNLESWVKWVHLPVENYKAFPCLKKLSITSCKSLRDDLLPNLPSLKKLLIQSCPSITAINQIPLTIQSLKINECEKLRAVQSIELASSSCNDKEIEEKGVVAEAENVGSLEDTVKPHGHSAKVGSQLPHLTKVKITECPNLISLLEGFLFPALKQLEFEDCNNMEGLPSQMHKCTNLQTLRIQRCPRIDCFPEGGLLKNLTRLEIEGVNIKQPVQEWGLHILNSLHYLTLANVGRSSDSAECSSSPCSDLHLPSSLSELRITNFPNLKSISCGSTSPNLTRLWVIDCAKLESLVGDDLTLLTSLSLKSCPTFLHYILGGPPIISSNSRIGDFTLLTRLSIWDMTNIDKSIRDWGLHLLTSLENLALHNLGSSIDSVECISGPELRLPSCLMVIDIMGFRNLKSISCRSSFPNLCWLFIQCCPKFESFGDNDLPSWLTVYIYDCDLIEQHLKSNHVHRITIGSEYHPPSY
ncbi:hypothetical protein BVRB_2g042670 [Beta vulgaris subsp. vulgaris]|nr:hypothetical protein BVRB_2g042670 [Beta vulgaris subsp. vulgaris]